MHLEHVHLPVNRFDQSGPYRHRVRRAHAPEGDRMRTIAKFVACFGAPHDGRSGVLALPRPDKPTGNSTLLTRELLAYVTLHLNPLLLLLFSLGKPNVKRGLVNLPDTFAGGLRPGSGPLAQEDWREWVQG
jgi:hypothetical protein